MENIIQSILDSDQYKYSIQQAILQLFPYAQATYKFINRGPHRFSKKYLSALNYFISTNFNKLKLQKDEKEWLAKTCPYFTPSYLEYLENYRFDISEVQTSLTEDNNLEITISGPWHRTVLWEVPLMALISELYFLHEDKNWTMDGQKRKIRRKAHTLNIENCPFIDFGTRRRRNFTTQDLVVQELVKYPNVLGTSNPFLAKKYNIKALGSNPHEWTMGHAVLCSANHANRYAMENWVKVYNGELGIALTDTYGTDAFLKDFDLRLSNLYNGIRQDSGNSFTFVDKMLTHYKKMNIDPMTKTIVFSDSLDVQKVIKIKKYCEGKIKCVFGIGTSISNSFDNSPALNMVIKLTKINDQNVVKLGDGDGGKITGDPNAVKLMKHIYFGEKL